MHRYLSDKQLKIFRIWIKKCCSISEKLKSKDGDDKEREYIQFEIPLYSKLVSDKPLGLPSIFLVSMAKSEMNKSDYTS